jgi:hypothetical protein
MDELDFEQLGEMVPARMHFTFVGTTSKSVSLDPREYRGKSLPTITKQVMDVMRSIAPDVDFFEEDIVEAASELVYAGC